MAELVLADQLPLGWIDDKEEERYRLEVGDLVTLLSGALRKRWRFNLMTKKIELDGKPIPVFELENLYCHLSLRGYTISKDQAIDAAKTAAMASFHPVREYLDRIASDDNSADLDQITVFGSMIRCTTRCCVRRLSGPLNGSMNLGACSVPALFSKAGRTLESRPASNIWQ